MQGPVRHLVVLLCTMLFVQRSLAVFQSLEEFMAYYFPEFHSLPEESDDDVITEPFTQTGEDLTTEWMTTFFSTTVETTPNPLINRCCGLGRYVANEELSCQLIDDVEFLSKGRNRPANNFRRQYGVSSHYRHLYEECASFHAVSLRNEFMRCCKETALAGEIYVEIPIRNTGGKKYETRYMPGLRRKPSKSST